MKKKKTIGKKNNKIGCVCTIHYKLRFKLTKQSVTETCKWADILHLLQCKRVVHKNCVGSTDILLCTPFTF